MPAPPPKSARRPSSPPCSLPAVRRRFVARNALAPEPPQDLQSKAQQVLNDSVDNLKVGGGSGRRPARRQQPGRSGASDPAATWQGAPGTRPGMQSQTPGVRGACARGRLAQLGRPPRPPPSGSCLTVRSGSPFCPPPPAAPAGLLGQGRGQARRRPDRNRRLDQPVLRIQHRQHHRPHPPRQRPAGAGEPPTAWLAGGPRGQLIAACLADRCLPDTAAYPPLPTPRPRHLPRG